MTATVWGAQTPSTAQARDVAVWLLGEAAAHRMPPIVDAEPRFESVHITIQPEAAWQWRVWCNLLQAERITMNHGADTVTARGHWAGVRVRLTGVEVSSWTS